MTRFFFYSLTIIFILEIQFFSVGCANMVPPQGGLRDTIPPSLVHASPPDSSHNFQDSRITLTFSEFVTVENTRENLIISPLPKNDPIVEYHLRTVTVRLKDTLQPNTTYTLDFGKAIRDVNEGNIDKNFTYLFSTGPTFDSLSLAGKVVVAETGRPDSTLIVMLHVHGDDSAVVNEKPRYITRLDSSGNFTFRNLPAGRFYIYALDDQGGGHRYYSEKQLFAFRDSAVEAKAENTPITLYAFGEKSAPTSTVRSTSAVPGQISSKQKLGGGQEKRLKLQTNLTGNEQDLLTNLVINSELPLKNLDTSLIHFSRDSSFVPVSDYHLSVDSSKKKLTLQYSWKENNPYHLIIEKNFATDSLGRALLKTDTINFKTKKLSDYGSLRIRFINFDPSINPVLQFVQSDQVVKSIPLKSADVNESLFRPGDYQLRILHDRNKNGKWDTGEFFGKHLQPEVVKPVTSRPRLTVKPDWENDFDIVL